MTAPMWSWLPTIRPRPCSALLLALGLLSVPRLVKAQYSDEARAQADTLFREGQQLMTRGQLASACAKLEESQRIDPKLGRLLNVAYCHEQLGRTATAWGEYNQAAVLALQSGQSEREAFAHKQGDQLAHKLSLLQIDISATPDLAEVTIDGRQLAREQWALPLPIDPGSHTLSFATAGHKARTQTVLVSAAGTLRLAAEPAEVETHETAPHSSFVAPRALLPPAEPAPTSNGRVLGWIFGAAGGAALGVGAGFGLRALSLKNEADPMCPNRSCMAEGTSLIQDAKVAATVATVGFVVGVVGVGAGAWLILRPRPTPAGSNIAAYVTADLSGIAIRGVW